MESTGDYIWKEPQLGQTIIKIIDEHGDGNLFPFRGQLANELYVRVTLAATLFAARTANDAYLTLTFPPGYTCVVPTVPLGSYNSE